MGQTVLIQGDGLAACCAAHLLRADNLSVTLARDPRPKPPTILVSEATQHLLCDIFEDRDLFRGFTPINKRIVAWGPDAEPVVLPHSAKVVAEQELLDRLWPRVHPFDAPTESDANWTLLSTRPSTPVSREMHFGSRIAQAQPVTMKGTADRDACWVESVETGWLFLLPAGDGRGTLISVGGAPDMQLLHSQLIRPQVVEPRGRFSTFPAYPRILSKLGGNGGSKNAWLACGSAAMAFDPLCGEGAGNAAREAILAAAVIRANAHGEAWGDLCAHYSSRLLGGFLRHLSVCQGFYASGHIGPWWGRERAALDAGMEWVRAQSVNRGQLYRLNGFGLEPIAPAAQR